MKQEDNEKIREAFEPIYQWLRMLSGGIKIEGFHTDKETKNANKSLKASIKKERKMMAMLIIWFIAWTCITYFLSWLLNVLRSHGFSVIDNHYILTLNFFITFIGIIVIIWKLEKIKKQNKQNYDLEITQKALQEVLPGAVCRPDDFIDPNRLYHLGIIPQYTEADGSYLIEFIENGQKCCISNLFLERKKFENRNKQISEVAFLGQAYILNYKSTLAGNVRIVTKDKLSEFKKRTLEEEKIETTNSLFNSRFNVYASDNDTVAYCLSPYVMEQLIKFQKSHGSFGVAISGNVIAVAINSGKYLFGMPVRYDQIDYISIENSKLELQQILSLSQQIGNVINGRIYR